MATTPPVNGVSPTTVATLRFFQNVKGCVKVVVRGLATSHIWRSLQLLSKSHLDLVRVQEGKDGAQRHGQPEVRVSRA